MEHLSMLTMKDILTIIFTIVGIILTPILGLLGMMWYHVNGQFKEIRGEMKEMEIRMETRMQAMESRLEAMESRLAYKVDSSHQSLEGKISKDRERISHIEGYLQLTPTTPPQVEIAEKKKQYKPQTRLATA